MNYKYDVKTVKVLKDLKLNGWDRSKIAPTLIKKGTRGFVESKGFFKTLGQPHYCICFFTEGAEIRAAFLECDIEKYLDIEVINTIGGVTKCMS